ncbi:hypothetical protein Tsubulata_037832 [Turnera subulata]|uniref:DUF4283 domain-containing protein n=1 Tax=Turnera subulata TaxID=218843 RepID=A0A9Q0G7J1_9ROSI|nr:hypothetical protein Tsubulata_037832 [Turnera subulata]
MTARKNLSTSPMSPGLPSTKRINSVPVDDGVLRANLARRKDSNASTKKGHSQATLPVSNRVSKDKTFAQSVKGKEVVVPLEDSESCAGFSNILYNSSKESSRWLSNSAFGILAVPLEIGEIVKNFRSKGFQNITDTFKSLRAWQPGDYPNNRRCWIQVNGVPVQAWNQEFFHSMAMRFGRMIKLAEVTEKRIILDYAYMQVLTTVKKPIHWVFNAVVDGVKFTIKASEAPISEVQYLNQQIPSHNLEDLISLDQSPGIKAVQAVRSSGQLQDSSSCRFSTSANFKMAPINLVEESDPFKLMDIIEKVNQQVPKAAVSPLGKSNGGVLVSPRSMPADNGEKSNGDVLSSKDRQQHVSKSDGPPLIQFGRFYSLEVGESSNGKEVEGVTKGLVPYDFSGSPCNPTPVSVEDQGSNFQPMGLSVTSFNKAQLNTPPRSNSICIESSDPSSVEPFLESSSETLLYKLLEKKLARVSKVKKQKRKQKFKRINDKGSVVSTSTIGDSEIRRVNSRFGCADLVQFPLVPHCDVEAENTIQVGNQLGWKSQNGNDADRRVARELIEKEGSRDHLVTILHKESDVISMEWYY